MRTPITIRSALKGLLVAHLRGRLPLSASVIVALVGFTCLALMPRASRRVRKEGSS